MQRINFHFKSQKAPFADFEISILFFLLVYEIFTT